MILSNLGKMKILDFVCRHWSGNAVIKTYRVVEELITTYEPDGFDFSFDDRLEIMKQAINNSCASTVRQTYKAIVDALCACADGDGTEKTALSIDQKIRLMELAAKNGKFGIHEAYDSLVNTIFTDEQA